MLQIACFKPRKEHIIGQEKATLLYLEKLFLCLIRPKKIPFITNAGSV